MKKLILAMLVVGAGWAQNPTVESKGQSAAEQLKDALGKFSEQVDGLNQDLADLQLQDIQRMEAGGSRVRYVSYQQFKSDQASLTAGLGGEYDNIAIEFQPGEAEVFYTSLSTASGYQQQVDQNGTVMFSSSGSVCPCCGRVQTQAPMNCVPYQQSNCVPCPTSSSDCGPCPDAQAFQQYNAGRPIGERIFGPGYDGRTLRSTWQAAPLRPYLITHAFQRLDNPTKIGQGRILNFALPRIRYKNGHICTEHDMKVHLGRRQWAIVAASSAGAGGGGGAAMGLLLIP